MGAISISAPSDRMDKERFNSLGPLVLKVALNISRRQGYAGTVVNP